ncbi:3,4-dihydroxy-2-butanone-4-phosphate synthase [Schleiferia thermophila]
MSGNQPEETKYKLNTVEEAIEDIRNGKIVIVVDDEDRENEGDIVAAAEKVTPEIINFMARHGRGLICVPLTDERCDQLDLPPMVTHNTDPHHTAFTVSVDLKGHGNTTGISAADRARTIRALVDDKSRPEDFARPGHIFPLRARPGGVLRRTGHTEAAIDLARLAGLKPAGVIVEIMNEDGSMARLPELIEIARKFNLKIISIEDLVAYRMKHESLIRLHDHFDIQTPYGPFHFYAFEQTTNQQIHMALTTGQWSEDEPVMVRLHSALAGSDLLSLIFADPAHQLHKALKKISQEGKGAIVYLNQNNLPPHHLLDITRHYKQHRSQPTPSFTRDPRDIGIGAQILRFLHIRKVKLLTNNPIKRVGVTGYGLEIVDNVTFESPGS